MFRAINRIGYSLKRNSIPLTGFQVKRTFYDAEVLSEDAWVTPEEPVQEKRERSLVASQIPFGYMYKSQSDWLEYWSARRDLKCVLEMCAKWMMLHKWSSIKQFFEFWIRFSYNKPDVNLYNHYVRANMMMKAPMNDLLDMLGAMHADFGIVPNLTSYNLMLKAMTRYSEVKLAVKLLDSMIETREFFPHPDKGSYALVILMLLQTNEMEDSFKYINLYLKSGLVMTPDMFIECVRYCDLHGRVDILNSIIQRCKETNQDLSLNCASCCHILDIASRNRDSVLAFSALELIAKLIVKFKKNRYLHYFSMPKNLYADVLQIAKRTHSNKLVDGAWYLVQRSLGQMKVPSRYYIERIDAYASIGSLEKAFGTLRALESLYGGTTQQADPANLFSPFSSLRPLVLACSRNGCHDLDYVYYQLVALSKENPPYKSVAALNCIILGCAYLGDVIRAKETFEAISTEFGLTPDINSYNCLIWAFGEEKRRGEALELFEDFKGLGIKPNKKTYELLVDAHLNARDPKSALSIIDKMEISGFQPTYKILKKVRRCCVEEMDTESDDQVEALAKKFGIKMPTGNRP